MEPAIKILLLLILAHLIGDFLLQPNSWVKAKKEKHFKSWQLYVHTFIHSLMFLLILPGSWSTKIIAASLIFASHAVIDGLKIFLGKNKTSFFVIDQILHIFIIVLIWATRYNGETDFTPYTADFFNTKILLFAISFIIAWIPFSFFIDMATQHWRDEIGENDAGLKGAGKWIGRFERILILTFIYIGQFSAIGFLLGAKSVFRFGDLKDPANRKKTEYILLGTLLSFTITILLGLGIEYVIGVIEK